MTQRKHVHSNEVGPVAEAIREYLIQMVPLHESDEVLIDPERSQFRVLYRFEYCNEPGKPSYPQPETWGTVAQYLGIMVPLHSIEDLPQDGELDTQNSAPSVLNLPCLATLNNMEDY